MSLKDRLLESQKRDKTSEMSMFSGFRDRMRTMIREEVERFKDEIIQELKAIMREKIGQEGINTLKGDSGKTPQKYIDYFTKDEIDEIKKEITPLKGRDYFDGRTPRKGKDYFDGEKGEPGRDGILPHALAIAKKLNTQEDIIDQKVIKGLVQMFRSMQRTINLKGGGGGMSTPVHQQFTGDGSTTSFTLSNNVAGNSKAILGFLNGQQISLTTHYTVSGKTISTTFTPVGQPEPDKLEFVYWRK